MHELVRQHVGRRLAAYYAQPAHRVVGRSSGTETTKLSTLLGEWHWRRILHRFYEEREGHWLTPVELFQPHFSHILADFCCSAVKGRKDSRMEIIELGGGRGTNAKHILSYLQANRPQVYEGLTYTMVDSSPSLHAAQQELFREEHGSKMDFRLMDLTDVAEKRVSLVNHSDIPTVILAMEVLDNLPHDKVQAKSRKRIEQAEVHCSRDGNEELFVPLEDPLLEKVLRAVPTYAKPYPTWVPTVACGLLEHLIDQRPNLGVAFADFDWLPPPDLVGEAPARLTALGEGEPIITDMDGMDHECYLQAPLHCDILFPTDFDKLASFAKRRISLRNRECDVTVDKQADFLEKYGADHVRKTKSWLTRHTPLLQDFVNCSVLSITTKAEK